MRGSKTAKKLTLTDRRTYQILRAPVITEKTTNATQQQRYTFVVHPDANKYQVAQAVESLFKVTVESVNVLNRQGKSKRFRGIPGRQGAVRRAIVKLKSGSIDLGGKV